MSITRIFFVISVFFVPLFSFAAFNDATLTTDVIINTAGINLNVSGSSAVIESITVNAASFSFVLQSGSSIQVTSLDRRVLSTDAASQYIAVNTCDSTASILKHSSSVAGSVTITVTPQSSTCVIPVTSSASGGGSVSLAYLSPKKESVKTAQNLPTASGALHEKAAEFSITRSLSRGTKHAEVSVLQTLLSQDTSLYPEGLITGYFGMATARAVKKFQEKYGIAKSGERGYGIVGPKTRAKLKEIFGIGGNKTVLSAPNAKDSLATQIEAAKAQIIKLQAEIKAMQGR